MSNESTPSPQVSSVLDIPPTQVDLDYADLPVIDLSLCDTYEGRCQLAHQVYDALTKAGFFYIVNHGMTLEETKHMFEIADIPFSRVDEEEKTRYTGNIKEGNLYQGYKERQAWHVQNGIRDQLEIYNINRDVHQRQHPEVLRPFLPQISTFAHHVHTNVLHQILRLLALGLELPEETFVNLHNFDAEGFSSVRFLKYYPRSEEEETKSNNVWLKGHNDTGTISILYSQPISALQVLSPNGTWKWVRHIENALVINTGESMEFLSGGMYPATIHRVVQPPPDQRNQPRLGLCYFCMTDDDVILAPARDSPVLQRAGLINDTQQEHPTMLQWRMAKYTTYGQTQLVEKENGVEEEVLLGKVVKHYL